MSSIKPIEIEIPIVVKIQANQAQIIPYLEVRPLRRWFDIDKYKSRKESRTGRLAWYQKKHWDFRSLKQWAASDPGKHNPPRKVLELHLPCTWGKLKERKGEMLLNPKYRTALYFSGGPKFEEHTGHSRGTEFFVIDDIIYRRLTWRSITPKYWPKNQEDSGITWALDDEVVYFLYRCEKINKEPIKSLIIDGIGLELLERDKPKPKDDEEDLPF